MLAPLIAGTSPACVSSAVRCAAVDHDARLDSSPWLAQAHRLGGRHWVANADVQVDVVTIGQQSVPVTLLAGAPSSSTYVASLHAAWISYPFAEVVARATRWQRTQAGAALLGAAPLTALLHSGGLHRAALVANHLLSTNLHTAWNASDIRDATAALVTRYPDRPLAMRNVCPAVDARLCEALTAAGWLLVPARRIYLVDPRDPAVWRHNHLKRDRKLLNGDDLELVGTKDIPAEELPSLRALFRELFLDKHCALNPDFTPAFFQLCHEHGFLDLYVATYKVRSALDECAA